MRSWLIVDSIYVRVHWPFDRRPGWIHSRRFGTVYPMSISSHPMEAEKKLSGLLEPCLDVDGRIRFRCRGERRRPRSCSLVLMANPLRSSVCSHGSSRGYPLVFGDCRSTATKENTGRITFRGFAIFAPCNTSESSVFQSNGSRRSQKARSSF